jgi:hypothetical protein
MVRWSGLKGKKDYRALAAIHNSQDYSEAFKKWEKRDIADEILREAGSEAVDAIIEELATDGVGSDDLADLLIDIGDLKAVPLLKRKLDHGDFDAYSSKDRILEFVARFDSDVRKRIEELAREEEEKLAKAKVEVASYDEVTMLTVLRKLCKAYAKNDTAAYKELEPLATAIGQELNRRGGLKEMLRMFNQFKGMRGSCTLEMHWGDIGEWRG